MSTRCMSSHLLSRVLEWRNPQGAEERWITCPQGIPNIWQFRKKVAAAEVGIVVFTAIALVETVAYATLALASLALSPLTKRPYQFFASLLKSSSFTVLWGCADALIYNPFFVNVLTRESFARVWAQSLNPTPIRMLRPSDMMDIAGWERQHMPQYLIIRNVGGLLGPVAEVGRKVNEGAAFINQAVLAQVPTDKIESLKEMDPEILHLFLTKAVAIYTIGLKSRDRIPTFFKADTISTIERLRVELPLSSLSDKLLQNIFHLEEYAEEQPQNDAAKRTYASLKEAASSELQGGVLLTGCLQKALESLSGA